MPHLAAITGSVINFMENGESLGNWSVMLRSMDAAGAAVNNLMGITDEPADENDNFQFVGGTMATIGGASAMGTWTGMFYGAPTADGGRKDGRPNAVAGQFDAIADHSRHLRRLRCLQHEGRVTHQPRRPVPFSQAANHPTPKPYSGPYPQRSVRFFHARTTTR